MEVSGILGLIVLVADIYAILKIAESSATTGWKTLWIATVILLPVLGLVIWFFFGPRAR